MERVMSAAEIVSSTKRAIWSFVCRFLAFRISLNLGFGYECAQGAALRIDRDSLFLALESRSVAK